MESRRGVIPSLLPAPNYLPLFFAGLPGALFCKEGFADAACL